MAWNRRGYDALDKDVTNISQHILPSLSFGDIVLLHDSTPVAVEILTAVLSQVKYLSEHSRK